MEIHSLSSPIVQFQVSSSQVLKRNKSLFQKIQGPRKIATHLINAFSILIAWNSKKPVNLL
jgi:hypothetical protein